MSVCYISGGASRNDSCNYQMSVNKLGQIKETTETVFIYSVACCHIAFNTYLNE